METLKQTDLSIGDRVHYQPEHYGEKFEDGIVKEIPEHTTESVRVVYNCGGDWDNYKNYTSALTNLRDLKEGWGNECDECGGTGEHEINVDGMDCPTTCIFCNGTGKITDLKNGSNN